MFDRSRRPLFAALFLVLAAPAGAWAQTSEAIPPWGKALAETSSAGAEKASGEASERHEPGEGESHCAEGTRFWFEADYLLWFAKNSNVPVLLTRGQTTVPRPGALDQAGTKFLFGGPLDFEDRNGARFTAGFSFGPERKFGAEGSYLFLCA